MARPWFSVLQAVPWGQVIDNAPKVVDGAKKFWSAVAKRPPMDEGVAVDMQPAEDETVPLKALRQRISILEKSNAELRQQMLASSELIKSLADQNAQLIRRIEANRKQMIRLTWIALTSAAAVLGVIAFIATHHAT